MSLIVPLPQGVRDVLGTCTDHTGLVGVHPGLVLDKFALSWDDSGITKGLSERVQKPVIDQVVRLSASPPPGLPFDDLVARWERATAGAIAFTGTTAGPLTLHLSRASALENAGICLHPIYGFTYLPGSGLKGLAHAFACEVWFPTQSDKPAAWETICRVFGTAPSNWLKDLAARLGVPDVKVSKAGAVVFYDAWPRTWPTLRTDILNSHHAEYYMKDQPPGDWENPVPVYFLSVPPGVPFRFAVAKRRDDVPQADADLAADWLAGGLTTLGCGAKTAAGYGHFTVDRPPPGGAAQDATRAWGDVLEQSGRKLFRATLELVTPAFLAGANQTSRTDCDLRPTTLRGLLRWWWRTMHAGFVDTTTLRRMEAAIWGDTKRGGAVRLTVTAIGKGQPQEFAREQIRSANKLPKPNDHKTSQGLTYHTYGADDNKNEGGQIIHVRRCYLEPGAKWAVTLTARAGQLAPTSEKGKPIDLPADLLLEQARAALVLLCHFGGAGAKGRKGFGSFADLPGFDIAAVKRTGADFRARCSLGAGGFQEQWAESPALEQLLGPVEVPTGGTNWWLALDQLAAAAQQFAKRYKHRVEKKALGLPRRVDAPPGSRFVTGRHIQKGQKERHASPVLYHLDRVNGLLIARVVAFPAAELPNLADSRKLLQELLDELRGGLAGWFDEHVKGKPPAGSPSIGSHVNAPVGPQLKVGQMVKAKMVPDEKGKGRPFAEAGGRKGIVEGVPAGHEWKPVEGAELVELVVKVLGADGKQITFKWPT